MSDNIDDLFRKRLATYENPPPMHLWDGIVQERKRRKGAGFNIRLFSAVIAAIGLLALGIWYWQKSNTNHQAVDNITKPIAKKVPTTKSIEQQQIVTTDIVITEQTNTKTVEKISNTTALDKEVAQPITSDQSATKHTDPLIAKTVSPVTETASNNNSFLLTNTSTIDNNSTFITTNEIAAQDNSTSSITPSTDNATSIIQSSTVLSTPKVSTAVTEDLTLHFLANRFDLLQSQASAIEAIPTISPVSIINDKQLKIKQLAIDIWSAPVYAFRKLKAKSTENESYLALRDSTEQFRAAWSNGVRFSTSLNNGLVVRTGLQYDLIRESYHYTNDQEKKINITNIYDNTGAVIAMDTSSVLGLREKQSLNTYRSLEVPLMIGYEYNFNKWTYSANVGATWNIWFAAKGDFNHEDGYPVSFDNQHQDNLYPAFKNKVGMSLMSSVNVAYQLSNRVELVLEPFAKYQLSPVTLNKYSLSQQYFNVGLSAGVRIKV